MSPVTPPDDSAPYRLTLTNAAGDVIQEWRVDECGRIVDHPRGYAGLCVEVHRLVADDREDSIRGAA